MGFLDWLGLGRNSAVYTTGVVSPWQEQPTLPQGVLISEALGLALADQPMNRAQAMSVPAVARGRHLLVSTIAPLPLVAMNADGPLAVQPSFLYRSDTAVSPAERTARTVDSLIFHGVALWAVKRGAMGQITDAAWVPHDRWAIRNDGAITIDSTPVDESQVLLFNGWNEGLLYSAGRTLRGAAAIENAWVSRAANPIPLTVIRHEGTEQPTLDQDEIDNLLAQWSTARKSEGGALGYLPQGLTIDTHGQSEADMFEGARNALRVDIASFMGIPAQLLDGSVAAASLTYSTAAGNRNRFYDETLPLYTSVIEQTLSQDSSVPRGTRVRFDRTELHSEIPTPTGAPVED